MFSMPESMSAFAVILSAQPITSSTSMCMELVSESLRCGGLGLCLALDLVPSISMGLLGTRKGVSTSRSLYSFKSSPALSDVPTSSLPSMSLSLSVLPQPGALDGETGSYVALGLRELGVEGGDTEPTTGLPPSPARRAKRRRRI